MQMFEWFLKFVNEITFAENTGDLQHCCLISVELCTRNLCCGINCESASLCRCFALCTCVCVNMLFFLVCSLCERCRCVQITVGC
jgi:hypothetical protein